MGKKHLTPEANKSSNPNVEISEYLRPVPLPDFIWQLQNVHKQERATATKHVKD